MLIFKHLSNYFMGFPYSSHVKESAYNAGDPGSILGLGRFHREGNGNPLQYSCLQNPMDRGIWQAFLRVARVRPGLATKPPPCINTHPQPSIEK